MTPSHVKVHFTLRQDGAGYPPAAVESVCATPGQASGEFVLDNIPFFASVATIGDIVAVRANEAGLWFERVAFPSHNSLIRIVFFHQAQRNRVAASLGVLGCSSEYLAPHSLLAVNIPGPVPLADVQAYLAREANAGTLDYEEPILRQ